MKFDLVQDLKALISNNIVICALLGWGLSQLAKLVLHLIIHKKLDLQQIFANGGMPSSHSATVIAAATSAAIAYGLGSAPFAITVILAVIVMNDAAGVRWQTGQLSKAIKKLWDERSEKKELDIKLKDVMGHRPLEIIVGAVVGFVIAITYALIYRLITGSLPMGG